MEECLHTVCFHNGRTASVAYEQTQQLIRNSRPSSVLSRQSSEPLLTLATGKHWYRYLHWNSVSMLQTIFSVTNNNDTRLTAIFQDWTTAVSRYQNVSILEFSGAKDNAELLVTTGAISRANSSQVAIVNKSTPRSYRPDALPVTQPTVSEYWMEYHAYLLVLGVRTIFAVTKTHEKRISIYHSRANVYSALSSNAKQLSV